jgi:hypothetical protein
LKYLPARIMVGMQPGDEIVTTPSLTELAEECRSLMRTARETASRLEFVADELAARAAWIDDAAPAEPRKRASGDNN